MIVHECLPKPTSNISPWSAPVTFTTNCDVLPAMQLNEGFEGANWPPVCWVDPVSASYGWNQDIYGSPNSGLHWAYCNLAGSELYTPFIPINGETSLIFYYKPESSFYPQDMQVKINGTVVYNIAGATNNTYQKVELPLSAFVGQNIQISFLGLTGTGSYDYGMCLDDVMFKTNAVWTGLVSTAWTDPGNWLSSFVPNLSSTVQIPGGLTNYPVIASGVNATCYEIILDINTAVTVETGGTLYVVNP
jgi:hypothetical protein